MNAWVLHKHGTTKEAFQLRQVPDPEPGPGQLLIRSEGFGLNYADVMARRGLYRDAPPVPCVIGYETVGRVERCGAGVPSERLGQRVVAMTRFGGYAELAVTDHRAAAVVPDALGIGEACALATQGCTAWYMARYACPLREGQRVLIHSAAGGVGQLLVQLAVRAGCDVFAIASGAEKMAYLKQLGAQHVIDRSAGDYATAVERALGSHRLDVSFNAVGGSTFKKDMQLIGSGGAVVLYGGAERGNSGGPFATLAFVWRMGITVPIFLMMKSRSLIGVNMLRISEHQPALLGRCLHEVVQAVREGWLVPRVHQLFGADQLAAAHDALEGGRTIGKVAVRW